jgi:uncharacterized protein (DUF4415 family)
MPERFEPQPKEAQEPEGERVEDIKEAWIGAEVEKPFREAALLPELTEEEKATLRKLAEKQAEAAMAEYRAEKEKNPVEQLLKRFERAEQTLEEKGLREDAEIVAKFKERFQRTLEKNREFIRKWNKENKDNLLRRVAGGESMYYAWQEVKKSIPIFSEIGEGGGWIGGEWFGDASDLEKYKDRFERRQKAGHEMINYSMSPEGETVLYRELGALHQDEEVKDLRAIWEKEKDKPREESRLSGSYLMSGNTISLSFTTELPGVVLTVYKNPRRSYDGKREASSQLELDNEFLTEALKET